MTIRVYVVDDSAVVRQTLQFLLQGAADIELVGSAPNPLLAGPAIRKLRPDVLLLDIEMPGMDGLTAIDQTMESDPIPTVICSTLTTEGSQASVEALASGAISVIAKPRLGLKDFLNESRQELLQVLREAAQARPRLVRQPARTPSPAPPKRDGPRDPAVDKPVLIGSSTGGAQAVESVLRALPGDAPGIAIVQHMPERFTAMYAQRLDTLCAMNVREARDGDRLERGVALVAPGRLHMQLRRVGSQYHVAVGDGPPVNRHKPAVDVLFRSAAACAGADALAILLTGMGSDGARGMKAMHERGARTIAQDEASCAVFGMPKEAIALDAVDEVLPLSRIAAEIMRFDAHGHASAFRRIRSSAPG